MKKNFSTQVANYFAVNHKASIMFEDNHEQGTRMSLEHFENELIHLMEECDLEEEDFDSILECVNTYAFYVTRLERDTDGTLMLSEYHATDAEVNTLIEYLHQKKAKLR